MSPPTPGRWRHVLLLVLLAAAAGEGAPTAVAADRPLGPDPAPRVQSGRAAVRDASSQVTAQDTALAAAQDDLATARDRLGSIHRQAAELDGRVATGTAEVARLSAETAYDRRRLHSFVRGAFEGGQNSALLYIMAAGSFPEAVRRKLEVDSVGEAGTMLVRRIASQEAAAREALADTRRARDRLAVAREQAATAEELVATDVDRVQMAQQAAQKELARSNAELAGAIQDKANYDAEQRARAARAAEAARAAARQRAAGDGAGRPPPPQPGVVFRPVPGSTFTVDTDLTQPSGETAERLNRFLEGTALAGLGESFMAAERDHRVSARYFLAHAIEESSFGTSQIAQRKHNLFGFGADDANPYEDAVTFPSFQACIAYVSGFISRQYLTPGGSYYRGPTLRGMNVNYASDPHWADNIARIARTLP
ncbi:MAG: glucosaminidase domain-containing protein [Candidatus Dormibacteria bacterium]